LSFDFADRRKLDKIFKSCEGINPFSKPEDPFKHLDMLAEKVKYDIKIHERFAETSDVTAEISGRYFHRKTAEHLDNVLTYIDDIKRGES